MRWLRSRVLIWAFVILDIVVVVAAWLIMRHNVVDPASLPASTIPSGSDATPASATIVGPIDLAVSPGGAVLRTTRGSCDKREPSKARVWVAPSTGKPIAPVDVKGLQEVLGVAASDTALTIVGNTPGCTTKGFVSSDGGQTWTETRVPHAVWYLDTDTTATTVHGPAGSVELTCPPQSVAPATDPNAALVTCENAVMSVTGRSKVQSATYAIQGATAAVQGAGAYPLVLSEWSDCTALLQRVTSPSKWSQVACLGHKGAPLALARRGSIVYAQVGERLLTVPKYGAGKATVYPTAS